MAARSCCGADLGSSSGGGGFAAASPPRTGSGQLAAPGLAGGSPEWRAASEGLRGGGGGGGGGELQGSSSNCPGRAGAPFGDGCGAAMARGLGQAEAVASAKRLHGARVAGAAADVEAAATAGGCGDSELLSVELRLADLLTARECGARIGGGPRPAAQGVGRPSSAAGNLRGISPALARVSFHWAGQNLWTGPSGRATSWGQRARLAGTEINKRVLRWGARPALARRPADATTQPRGRHGGRGEHRRLTACHRQLAARVIGACVLFSLLCHFALGSLGCVPAQGGV
jgi:hypothetical protein